MQTGAKQEKQNALEFNDPYTKSLRALYSDLEEQIEVTKRQLEYLEHLRRDLQRQQRRLDGGGK